MQRGIEGGRLFRDDGDRVNFLRRVDTCFDGTGVVCFVWSLMLNHVHLASRSLELLLSKAMHRLGSGYATSFNKRYERRGHLYQNRYKSLLIEDEEYLYEVIRYVLLNPIRSGQLRDLADLLEYPWTAYPALMGRRSCLAGDPVFTLRLFDDDLLSARSRLRDWLQLGLEQGDVIGPIVERGPGRPGRLVGANAACARIAIRDSGVLGRTDFVADVLCAAQNPDERAFRAIASGVTAESIVEGVCRELAVEPSDVRYGRRDSAACHARALIAWMSTHYLQVTQTDLAPMLGVSQQSVGRSALRGRCLTAEKSLQFERELLARL